MPKDPRATSPRDSDRLAYALEVLNRPDPNAAVKAAETALDLARGAGSGPLREKYIAKALELIARLDPRRQARTIQNLQGAVLALQGRGGDTEIAHVTPEELVIPMRMQTPELMAVLARAAQQAGIDPRRLRVGSGPRNPKTGHQEFFGAPEIEEIPVTARSNPGNFVLGGIEGTTVKVNLNDEIRRAQAKKDFFDKVGLVSGGLGAIPGPIGWGMAAGSVLNGLESQKLGDEIDDYREQQRRLQTGGGGR